MTAPATFDWIDIDIRLHVGGDRADLAVRGEIDIASAPDLAAALDAVTDRSYREVVVDLSGVTFFDGQGLRVVVDRAARLHPRSQLSLIDPSEIVRRLLQITGLDRTLNVSNTASQPTARLAEPESTSPANDHLIDLTLQLFVDAVATTLSAVDGISISLHRHGQFQQGLRHEPSSTSPRHDE